MRRIGSRSLSDYPAPVVRIDCERCGRAGRYALAGLIERFGADAALPDVLMELASCERRKDFSRPCGARFMDLSPPSLFGKRPDGPIADKPAYDADRHPQHEARVHDRNCKPRHLSEAVVMFDAEYTEDAVHDGAEYQSGYAEKIEL